MKYLLSFLLVLCLSISAISQTVVYTEDFEGSTYQVTNTGTGTSSWDINTRLQNGGLKCDSATLATAGDNPILQTTSFSTIGNSFVVLEFSHICHLDFFDGGIIEISVDNGATWTQLTGTQYTGSGNYATNSNQFNTNTYPLVWSPGFPAYVPDNTWWQDESFDISSIAANQASVLMRFAMNDNQNNGSSGYNGWFIDDIKVTMAFSELIPPVINNLSTNLSGTLFSIGPFPITAEITDQSGLDTAIVYYSINGGAQQSVGMTVTNGDTLTGIIPAVSDSDTVCFSIYARDAAASMNTSTEPSSGCQQFIASQGLSFPYFDNFDIMDTLWSHSNGNISNTTIWEVGTSINPTPYSNPNVWATNLNNIYTANAEAYLTSPVFDFSATVGATLKFQHYYYTEQNYDGVRLEYTLDGTVWQILGSYNDPLAINWYTMSSISSSSSAAWAGSSNGWIESEYPLDFLDNVFGPVQFRFVFTSDGSVQYDGFFLDNFSIAPPADYDLKLNRFTQPLSGLCYGNAETIELEIINVGINTINFVTNPITINASSTGVNPIALSPVVVNTDSLVHGDTLIVLISNNFDMGLSGLYSFNANINCAIDITNYNDTISSYDVINNTIQTFPFAEDFETFSNGSLTSFNGWTTDYLPVNSGATSFPLWTINNAGTSNTGTGPAVDHTTQTTIGKYIYFESSYGSINDTSLLISPCLIIPNASNSIQLSFWYHMFGANTGSLALDILDNGIWLQDQVILTGQQQLSDTEDWRRATINLDPYKGSTIKIRFKGLRGSSYLGDMAIDDISINEIAPIDIEAVDLLRTTQNICFSNSETIEVSLRNNGSDTIFFATNTTTINCASTAVNPTVFPVIVINSDTLAPGDTINVVISNNYDMSLSGPYTFNYNVTTIGDSLYYNDTIIDINMTNTTIDALPYLEDFETFSNGSLTAFNGWETDYLPVSSSSTSFPLWTVNNAVTGSSNTGPTIDHTTLTSIGKYIYTESSYGSLNDTSLLISPCILIPNVSNSIQLSFWYHMYGSTTVSLALDIFDNGIWLQDQILLTGQQQQSDTEDWRRATISLDSYKGSTMKIRFKGIKGSSYYGDMAIDDISINEIAAIDIESVDLLKTTQNMCFSNSETIEVSLRNNGSDTIFFATNTTTINCASTGINPTVFPAIVINSDTLAPGDTLGVVISNNYDMSVSGLYTFDFYQTTIGDSLYYNDTVIDVNMTNTTIGAFPYLEDFETTSSAYGSYLITPVGWENSNTTASGFYWRAEDANTSSSNTGPSVDHTLGTTTGMYFYTEANGYLGDSAFITSTCIDLNSLLSPKLRFWYHMYGATTGTLQLDVYYNGSWINDVYSLSGQQQSTTTDPWAEALVDLSPYSNSMIKIRFKGIKGSSYTGDMAIDDIEIFQPLAQDAGVIKILEPIDVASEGTYSDITVIVQNFGYDTIFNYDVIAVHNGGAPIIQNFSSSLAPSEFDTVSMNGFNLLSGANEVCAKTSLTGDTNSTNDSICKSYFGLPVNVLYQNDFDTPTMPFYGEPGSRWEWGTPAGTVINYAYSGTKSWMINLNGYYLTNQNDFLIIPPVFNFYFIKGATLSLAHWDQTTEGSDGGKVEYSTDYGTSWNILGYINDPIGVNWYNDYCSGGRGWTGTDSDWETSIYDLSQFDNSNLPVQFRVVFGSDAYSEYLDGFAIDNFAINVPRDTFDIGVMEFVDPPLGGSIPGTQQAVTIRIKNFGLNTVYSSLVKYIDHSGFATTETWTGVLPPDSTVDYTFGTTYFSPNNIHSLTALTYNYVDHYMFNDTLQQDIQVGLGNNDVGVTNIIKPNIINNAGEVLDVIVEVTNLGLNPVSNFDICYRAGNLPLVCETYIATLQAGQSINYTFTQTFTAPIGSFNFCAKTDLTNDDVSVNDEYCNMLSVGIKENSIASFTIGNCIPNPVTNNAIVPIKIEQSGIVKFDIYNNLGQIIFTNQYSFDAGENQIEFNAKNLPSGIYSYGISYNNITQYGRFNKN